jgi:hypothetical protein
LTARVAHLRREEIKPLMLRIPSTGNLDDTFVDRFFEQIYSMAGKERFTEVVRVCKKYSIEICIFKFIS